jgi:hypothetical protein
LTQQTKDEAREETLRRWHALPDDDRQTIEQANVFAAALADDLDFRTMGNTRRVILGWLIRDLEGKPAWGNVPPESVVTTAEPVLAVTAETEADEMDAAPLIEAELDDEIEQLADGEDEPADEDGDAAEVAALPEPETPDDDADLDEHRHAAE